MNIGEKEEVVEPDTCPIPVWSHPQGNYATWPDTLAFPQTCKPIQVIIRRSELRMSFKDRENPLRWMGPTNAGL